MAKHDADIPFSCSAKKPAPKPAVLVGVVSAAVVAAIVVGAMLLGALNPAPAFEVVKAQESGAASSEPADSQDEEQDQGTLFVHVGGEVVSPGLYELSRGSRVNEAIDAAGGFSENASRDSVNLARELSDGEQIIVASIDLVQEGAASSVGGESISSTGQTGKVNINTANADALDSLPGIGKSTAEKIVADRTANGPFKTPEDLKRVAGIGDKKFSQLADLITVG